MDRFAEKDFPEILSSMRKEGVSELCVDVPGLFIKIHYPVSSKTLQTAVQTQVSTQIASFPQYVAVKSAYVGLFSTTVREGQSVKKGEVLALVSALGLSHEITAPCDGILVAVFGSEGRSVDFGAVLFEIEPA